MQPFSDSLVLSHSILVWVAPDLCISNTAVRAAHSSSPNVCAPGATAEPGSSCFCLLFCPLSLPGGGRWHKGLVPVLDPPLALRSAGLSRGEGVPMPTVVWAMALAMFQLAVAGTSPSPNHRAAGNDAGASPQRPASDHGISSAGGWPAGPGEDCSLLLFLWSLLHSASVASSNGSLKKCICSDTTVCEAAAPSKPCEI